MIKVIKREWLPNNLPELAIWFANFKSNFTTLAVSLGFNPATVISVSNDEAVVRWLAAADEAFNTNHGGFRKIRDEILFEEKNSSPPATPVTDLPELPATMTWAIIQRLDKLVERIKLADNYTLDIGTQLGIVVVKGDSISPDLWKTSLTVKDFPAYELSIDFVKGEGEGILLQIQVGESDVWTDIGTFFKKPVIYTVMPPTPNAPVAVRLRARLLKNNKPVGEYSDTVNVIARA